MPRLRTYLPLMCAGRLQGLLKNWERLMEAAKAREASTMPRPSAAAAAVAAQSEAAAREAQQDQERQALLEAQRKQQLLQLDNELTFNEAVIEEREQAINEISGQIGEVHQIFQVSWRWPQLSGVQG